MSILILILSGSLVGGPIAGFVGYLVLRRSITRLAIQQYIEKAELYHSTDQKHVFYKEKVANYRLAVELFSEMIVCLANKEARLDIENILNIEKVRYIIYGYLAFFAPPSVIIAQDNLSDYLLELYLEQEEFDWEKIRELSLAFLNSMRADIGIAFPIVLVPLRP